MIKLTLEICFLGGLNHLKSATEQIFLKKVQQKMACQSFRHSFLFGINLCYAMSFNCSSKSSLLFAKPKTLRG